jgi:hypothetical protein
LSVRVWGSQSEDIFKNVKDYPQIPKPSQAEQQEILFYVGRYNSLLSISSNVLSFFMEVCHLVWVVAAVAEAVSVCGRQEGRRTYQEKKCTTRDEGNNILLRG